MKQGGHSVQKTGYIKHHQSFCNCVMSVTFRMSCGCLSMSGVLNLLQTLGHTHHYLPTQKPHGYKWGQFIQNATELSLLSQAGSHIWNLRLSWQWIHQCWSSGFCNALWTSELKMEAVCSSEMLVSVCKSMWHYYPDRKVHIFSQKFYLMKSVISETFHTSFAWLIFQYPV
jgi:hypothetical protein